MSGVNGAAGAAAAAASPPGKHGALALSSAADFDPSAMHIDPTTHLHSTSPHSAFSPDVRTPEAGPVSPHQLPELFTFAKQPVKVKHLPPALAAGQGYSGARASSATGGHEVSTDSEAGLSDGAGGASEAGGKAAPPLSLLTALLQSPQHSRISNPRSTYTASNGGLTSARSSAPSTALSSPQAPHHGILQNHINRTAGREDTPSPVGAGQPAAAAPPAHANGQPASILRRGSTGASSDGGEIANGLALGLSQLHAEHAAKLETVEEKRERIAWADTEQTSLSRAPSHKSTCLKFAVAPMTSGATHSASSDADSSRRPSLVAKRDGAVSDTAGRKRSVSPFARERLAQSELEQDEEDDEDQADQGVDAAVEETSEEEEEVKLPGYTKAYGPAPYDPATDGRRDEDDEEASEESDLGYQEDQEDGMFSDEEDPVAFRLGAPPNKSSFPFARPTNYSSRRRDRDRTHDRSKAVMSPSPGGSPPSAPSVLPAPPRRGRGHIRVMDPVSGGSGLENGNKPKGCSRHCSPPPARSRSGSNGFEYKAPPAASSPSAKKLAKRVQKSVSPNRLSDAGPRGGRAGSAMPRVLSVMDGSQDEEDEDEEDEEDEGEAEDNEGDRLGVPDEVARVVGESQAESSRAGERRFSSQRNRRGWRSDDSIFFGANSHQARSVLPARLDAMPRKSSSPNSAAMASAAAIAATNQPVFTEDDDGAESPLGSAAEQRRRGSDEPGQQSESGLGEGMRNFFRRASEHIPGFRRPSTGSPSLQAPSASTVVEGLSGGEEGSRPMTAPLAQSMTCPPALDDTPAIAASIKTNDGYVSDLATRLEKTLGSYAQQPHQTQPPTALLGDSLARPANGGDARRLSVSHTPGSRPSSSCSSAGAAPSQQGQAGLGRASTVSSGGGRVAFDQQPAQTGPISRTTSVRIAGTNALSGEGPLRREKLVARHVSEGAHATALASRPMACPKKMKTTEDTGWSDGQLLNIRKQAGKGEE